jgi:hypothetical protein
LNRFERYRCNRVGVRVAFVFFRTTCWLFPMGCRVKSVSIGILTLTDEENKYAELNLFITFVRFEVLTAVTLEVTVFRMPTILKMEAADSSEMFVADG